MNETDGFGVQDDGTDQKEGIAFEGLAYGPEAGGTGRSAASHVTREQRTILVKYCGQQNPLIGTQGSQSFLCRAPVLKREGSRGIRAHSFGECGDLSCGGLTQIEGLEDPKGGGRQHDHDDTAHHHQHGQLAADGKIPEPSGHGLPPAVPDSWTNSASCSSFELTLSP